MLINNSFEVPLPPSEAWKVLMDIPRIAPCMPGAKLTDVVDENTYNGNVSVRLGPVALTFAGTVRFTEKDEVAKKARVTAQGKDAKGRGGAHANVDFAIEPAGGGSRVLVKTDLALSGAVAQYGRASGMIQDVAQQLIGQFANSLKSQLAAAQVSATAVAPVAPDAARDSQAPAANAAGAKPQALSGFALLWMLLGSFFRRLSGSRKA
jgi:carbon monoxide dehydrogenase subunit G